MFVLSAESYRKGAALALLDELVATVPTDRIDPNQDPVPFPLRVSVKLSLDGAVHDFLPHLPFLVDRRLADKTPPHSRRDVRIEHNDMRVLLHMLSSPEA